MCDTTLGNDPISTVMVSNTKHPVTISPIPITSNYFDLRPGPLFLKLAIEINISDQSQLADITCD